MSCWTRRAVLRGVACAGVAGCGGATGTPSDHSGTVGCESPSSGTDATYCLMRSVVVRVVGAASLAPGQSVLAAVDDATAVIVSRDDRGLHALSAICTHACCVVALCDGDGCGSLTPSPDACGQTVVATADPDVGGAICPCHGSSFRLADGEPLDGPAARALPSYALSLDGDDVLVDTGTQVDAGARQ
ncbi:MAG: Rieske (2Fe-2S) protein [Myxococcales bacterium]|nr:Rieske (2Fe-2S) protein [Myxococcales bacterium]